MGHGAKSRTFNFLVFCINLHFLDACHLMFFRVALLSFNEYDIWAIKRYSVTFRAISADKKKTSYPRWVPSVLLGWRCIFFNNKNIYRQVFCSTVGKDLQLLGTMSLFDNSIT